MKRLLYNIFLTFVVAVAMVACIDDSFTNSPSDQPRFSVDTLDMGVIFTEQLTTTHRFTVANPSPKSISISKIGLSGEGARYFRLNVDGFSGREFNNVEIRGKDSIFVFVEATLPAANSDLPVEITAFVDFLTNGVTQSVVLSANGQDVVRLKGCVIDNDTRFDSAKPYQIFDSLVVAPGATLTFAPGTRLLFHDDSWLAIDGNLICEGTPERPVVLAGDRTGNVVSDISFDLMSRQWQGVFFGPGSHSDLTNTEIKNTTYGVVIDGEYAAPGETSLTLTNCRFHNSGTTALAAVHADIDAAGCEFAEGGAGLVTLIGGKHSFNHCTFANNYLFAAISGPALAFGHTGLENDEDSDKPYISAVIDNSIVYGLGADLSHGDLSGTDIYLRNCLLKSNGSDDENFINCLWDKDPLYHTIRNEYLFDYRLKAESPAIEAADATLSSPRTLLDAYGMTRGQRPDLGAYVYVAD